MRLVEAIHNLWMAERYQHQQPYKEVLKSISTDGTQYWTRPSQAYWVAGTYTYIKESNCEMIPVLDWNDQPCFYDRVAKELLYANTQTGLTYERWNMIEVDYLESSGSQYIDTGITLNQSSYAEIDFQSAVSIFGNTFFGARTSSTSNAFTAWQSSGGVLKDNYGKANGQIANNDIDRHTIIKDANKTYYDGTLVKTWTESTFTCPGTCALFALYENNAVAFWGSYRIFSAKIRGSNGERDYQPCVINGVGYMYDKVENKLYANAGSGSFSAGIIIDGVDYQIGSSITPNNYTNYIDTGIAPNWNYSAECRFKASNYGRFIFGTSDHPSYNEAVGYTLFVAGSSGMSAWGSASTSTVKFMLDIVDDTFATVRMDKTGVYNDDAGKSCLFTNNSNFSSQNTIHLFKSPATTTSYTGCTIASMKIWDDNSELVQNLIPCQYTDANNNTVTTMLDLVTKAPLTPSGSFVFNALGS